DWVFGDFQSLKPNPDEHRIQPIGASHLGRPWNPQHLSTVQLREFDNAPVPADSPAGQAYRWFMERIRSGAIATNLNWPDMTVHMTRFADGRWKAGLAEATAKWLLTRLENR
ncbi:hypothetical protein N0539_29070, partial [Pseudomonas aeruginosa]|nr:hypothetical protein [Pseudomonas aeruginosa]